MESFVTFLVLIHLLIVREPEEKKIKPNRPFLTENSKSNEIMTLVDSLSFGAGRHELVVHTDKEYLVSVPKKETFESGLNEFSFSFILFKSYIISFYLFKIIR